MSTYIKMNGDYVCVCVCVYLGGERYSPTLHNDLRNEFDFWKVHEIMNTLGLLQSK